MTLNILVIASHNEGKVAEIRALLAPLGPQVISARDADLPEPEETGATFAENAMLKATQAMERSGHAALADDSGLAVPALGGAPGIYSARWAGPEKDFRAAQRRIVEALLARGVTPEGAAAEFICVLALARPGLPVACFEGRLLGHLTFPPRGEKGFGYDPIFVPQGERATLAEIPAAHKQRISHRAQAFAEFLRHVGSVQATMPQ